LRTKLNRIVSLLWPALCLLAFASAFADASRPRGSGSMSDADVTALAMRWFGAMQAGHADRSQYASTYVAQITDQSVVEMSKTLNRYGAAPLRAEIVQTRTSGDQTFYVVKFIFPRGDATSLLFGFDTHGKITGIAIGGLAGD
jgi:hypothetical protein